MSPPSQRSIRLQQDREKSKDLLRIYGGLLTPKQYAMTAGFVLEGKSFSQIAREHGISRQAVHEVVRSVQRLLTYYEGKLLVRQRESDGGISTSSAQVAPRLRKLKNEVVRRGDLQPTTWIVKELDEVLSGLGDSEESVVLEIPTPESMAGRSPRSASGSARRKR